MTRAAELLLPDVEALSLELFQQWWEFCVWFGGMAIYSATHGDIGKFGTAKKGSFLAFRLMLGHPPFPPAADAKLPD